MLQTQPTLTNIRVVGNDSENVYLLYKNLMQDIYSLLCDIHMKDNLMGKGSKLNVKKEQMTEILSTLEKLLKRIFDLKLDHLREKWMGFGGKRNQFYIIFFRIR